MSRTLATLRFFLASHGKVDLPFAALLIPISLSGVLALIIRDQVTPFAFSVCALSLSAALVAIPLLGELGYLLRADPSSEWIEAQPIKPRELRAARTLHLLITLFGLTALPLIPVALLTPTAMGAFASIQLIMGALCLSATLAAILLLIQALLGGRAESVFVLLQTAIVAGVVLGLIIGLQHIASVAKVASFDFDSSLGLYPPAWFAASIGETPTTLLPYALGAGALLLLLVLPRPSVPTRRRTMNMMERLLNPVRQLAARFWLTPDERGPFDLIYDATPREREVILRSYPMLGIPLAFLLSASMGEGGPEREGLMALLLFTPGVYLPILLSQIPASDSHAARWLVDGAPISEGAWTNGAIKALSIRFLLPLYVLLALLAASFVNIEFAVRMAIPGALLSLLVLRKLYLTCVPDQPLTIAPDQLQTRLDWGGTMMGMAFGLTIAAVLANQYLSLLGSLGLVLCLVGLEWSGGRAIRRSLG
ncbi:MAG: hypothetical protein ACI8TQ_003582 [Planctomycetota bacterium]|jgi:hypothetical protein